MNTALFQGKSRLCESTREKVDSVGSTKVFHLIILNTSSGLLKISNIAILAYKITSVTPGFLFLYLLFHLPHPL
jgi:hypothetical protein